MMLCKVMRKGEVALCGTCMEARGLRDDEVIEGARRSTLAQLAQLAQLADWTVEADKVLVL
jgi:uncharacterized protein involved in oxidation of intracellular sulfur